MNRIKKCTAFFLASVMMVSAFSYNYAETGTDLVYAEDDVTSHINYYGSHKGAICISDFDLSPYIKMAQEDNKDNDYVMIETIMRKAGISQSQQEMVLGQGWSDDLAAEVLFAEILMSDEFIRSAGKIFKSEYDSLIDTIVTTLKKTDSTADKNSIYRITQPSFEKFFSNFITESQMKELKAAYTDTKTFYDACVAYTAYKLTRDSIVSMMKSCSNLIPSDMENDKFAAFLMSLAKGSTGVGVSSFTKVSNVISIADGADESNACEYAEVFMSEFLGGKCLMLGVLMPKFDMDFHKDIDFFSEVMKRYGCDVDSRAEERNLFIGASKIYSFAREGFENENGFSSDLLNKKTDKSVEIFDSGLMFMKKSAQVLIKHAFKYSTVKSVKDDSPEDLSLAMLVGSYCGIINDISCENNSFTAQGSYSSFIVPENLNFSISWRDSEYCSYADGSITNEWSDSVYCDIVKLSQDAADSKVAAVFLLGDPVFKAKENGKINICYVDSKKQKHNFTINAVSGNEYTLDTQNSTISDNSGKVYYSDDYVPPVVTTPVTTATTPVPTTPVTTTTTPVPTTPVTTTTTPVPTTPVTTTTTPVPTTPVTTTTTPVPTTPVTTTTTPLPTTPVTTTTTAVTTVTTPVTTLPVGSGLKGDLNNDGSVSASDIVYLCRKLLDPSFVVYGDTDINGDNETGSADLAALKNIILSR